MTRFEGGPADRKTLSLKRAPVFLRVVRNKAGEIDALDQLDDQAEADETLYAYRRIGEPSVCFVDGTRGGKRCGWTEQSALYSFMLVQPDDATMRDNAKWQAWTKEKYEVETSRML